jgi:hypothetical protein
MAIELIKYSVMKLTHIFSMFVVNACCLMLGMLMGMEAPAQSITLKGYVKDISSGKVLPFANIYINNSSLGTVSNSDGFFIIQIPRERKLDTLEVSHLGYQTQKISIADIVNPDAMLIGLTEMDHILKDVIVSAKTAAQIVAQAYYNIPLNYPLSNTLYTGFYRETNLHQKKDSAERCFYVIEAITRLNKPSYERRLPEGDIKIVKVRKNQFVGDDDKFTRWIAGAFTPIRFDVAKKRFDFIDPDRQDRYEYTIEYYSTYYDREVCNISFKPVKNSADYEGNIYIDVNSYAIVKVDYHFSESGLRRENETRKHAGLIEREFKINYKPLHGKWFIQSIWQQARGYDKLARDNYRYITEYATTLIDTGHYEKFEYDEKIQWGEVFLTKNLPYDVDFWKGFNVIAETRNYINLLIDTSFQMRIEVDEYKKKSTLNKIEEEGIKVPNRRFRLMYSINPTLLKFTAQEMTMQYSNESGNFTLNEQVFLKPGQIAWSSGFGLEYDIYRNNYLNLNFQIGFSKLQYSFTEFSLGHRFPLYQEKKRPFYFYLENAFALATLKKRIKDLDNTDATGFEVNGTIFDMPKVHFDLENRQFVLKPKAGFLLELNRKLFAFAEAGWLLPLRTREVLLFANENRNGLLGTIGQKVARLPLDDSRVDFRADGSRRNALPFENRLYLNIGIKGLFTFRN